MIVFMMALYRPYLQIVPWFIARHAKRQIFYTNMVGAKIILPERVHKLRQIYFATKQRQRLKRPK